MKKITYLFGILLLSIGFEASAQIIGRNVPAPRWKDPIPQKNTYIGIKGGVNMVGLVYQGKNLPTMYDFSLPRIPEHLIGGIFAERSLPKYSYGFELDYLFIASGSEDYHLYDTAQIVTARIPLRLKIGSNEGFTPYIFAAPTLSTCQNIIDSTCCITHYGSTEMLWGIRNTKEFDFGVTAGIGFDSKIQMRYYHILVRAEAAYNYGIRDMFNEHFFENKRYLRGLEASISIGFPLKRSDDSSNSWTRAAYRKARR